MWPFYPSLPLISLQLVSAMDKCKDRHNVPVQYATLRRRRRSAEKAAAGTESDGEPEGSGDAPDETENELSVADRVNMFIYCVFESIGALQEDEMFNAGPLIEELKQFSGDEKVSTAAEFGCPPEITCD